MTDYLQTYYETDRAFNLAETQEFHRLGKVVSYWAKAYRGIVLHELAKAGVSSIEAFMKLPIEGLSIHEIQTKKNKSEIIYTIEN